MAEGASAAFVRDARQLTVDLAAETGLCRSAHLKGPWLVEHCEVNAIIYALELDICGTRLAAARVIRAWLVSRKARQARADRRGS